MDPAVLPGVGAKPLKGVGVNGGGHAGFPVTLTARTHPALLVWQAPAGIGAAAMVRLPRLKKIQSLATPAPPPLGLKNSVTGEHAEGLADTMLSSGVPTPVRMPLPLNES